MLKEFEKRLRTRRRRSKRRFKNWKFVICWLESLRHFCTENYWDFPLTRAKWRRYRLIRHYGRQGGLGSRGIRGRKKR